VPLLHETHRGRALFTGPLCRTYLESLPELRLTADFSHLLCVHESNLSDQPAAVDAIIAAERRNFLTVTPEFGPPFYAPLDADSSTPVADPWKSNHWIRDELHHRWGMSPALS